MEEEAPIKPLEIDKKLKRKLKKAKKLITEFELAQSNDAIKRPGELLDSPTAQKKFKDDSKTLIDGVKPRLNPEEFKELKKQLQERKKYLTSLPRFYLQNAGLSASLGINQETRVPILVSDVQQMLLYGLGGNTVCHPPDRWCCLQKYTQLTHIVVLILEGLSCHDFFTYEHLLPKLTSIFTERMEVMSPFQYGNDVAQEMACVPLSQSQKQNILNKYGTLEAALQSKEVFKVFRALFPINFSGTEAEEEDTMSILSTNPTSLMPPEDMFPRTLLLLSLQQMVLEDYPLPFEFEMETKYAEFKMTRNRYKEVCINSPIFAVDCEMCMTDKNSSELTRIAIVDENLQVIYESLVKPTNKITNYLTPFSGITKEMMLDVSTTLEDVQKTIRKLLPRDAILVGHSLNCDLHAMKMIHPYVIDTSVVFNMSGIRSKKAKLSMLVEHFLHEEIQHQKEGHCPTEDATATMKLIKLKLAKGFRFGDALTADDASLVIPECQLTASIFNQTARANKAVSVIATESILEKYKNFSIGSKPGSFLPISITKSNEAIQRLQEATVNNNMSIAHLNLSKKMKNMDKLMTKIDTMCENVFNHVSRNGLFVTLFTGPNQKPKISQNDESDSKPKLENGEISSIINGSNHLRSTSTESNSQKYSRSKLRSHQNGVCFVRINTQK